MSFCPRGVRGSYPGASEWGGAAAMSAGSLPVSIFGIGCSWQTFSTMSPRKPPRDGGGARALSCGGWPYLGDQIRNVAVRCGEQFLPAQLRTHNLLKQLRS